VVRGARSGGNVTSVFCQLWAAFVLANFFFLLKPMWSLVSCWNRMKYQKYYPGGLQCLEVVHSVSLFNLQHQQEMLFGEDNA